MENNVVGGSKMMSEHGLEVLSDNTGSLKCANHPQDFSIENGNIGL